MGEWSEFLAAEVGASAALTGLVIVAISINVGRILSVRYLPGRAVETLIAPTGVLVVSSVLLVPRQPFWLMAGETLAVGLAMWLMPAIIQMAIVRDAERDYPEGVLVPRIFLAQFSSLPFVIGGALMLYGWQAAIYWIVPGIVFSLVATVINAWVLLVEILR